MAVEAPYSKLAKQNDWLVIIIFLALGLYFIYDGWISESYQRKNITWPVTIEEVQQPAELAQTLKSSSEPAYEHLRSLLSLEGKAVLASRLSDEALAIKLTDELNRMIYGQRDIYNAQAFMGIEFSPETEKFIAIEKPNTETDAIRRKLILADVLGDYLQVGSWKSGIANANLKLNRVYGPVIALAVIAYFLFGIAQHSKKKVVADDQQITIDGTTTIPYSSIQKIDKRFFDKEGHFTIEYQADGDDKKQKITRKKYQNLSVILDEIIKHTTGDQGTQEPSNA